MPDLIKQALEANLKLLESVPTRAEFVAAFKAAADSINKAKADLTAKIDARMATWRDGVDGKTPTKDEIVSLIKPLIPEPIKGDKGDTGPVGRSIFGGKGEPGTPGKNGKDGSPDTPVEVRDKLETLEGAERLDISAIKGVNLLEDRISHIELRPVQRGVGKGIGLYVGGTKKLLTAQTINLVAGANITITYAYANGRNDITISGGAGGALSVLAATGTIDDSNKVFTFASAPTLVIVNGAAYRDTKGVSISGTTATLDAPVGTGGDIYALG